MTRVTRALDSDLMYSFRRTPGAMIAAALSCALILGAVLAPVIAPHDPFDPSGLSILDNFLPPAWDAAGDPRFLLGTDDQGRDLLSAMLYGLRVSLAVALPRDVAFFAGIGWCFVLAESWVARRTRCVRLGGFPCEPVRLKAAAFVTSPGSTAAYADTRRSRYKQTLQQALSSASATVCKVSLPLRTCNVCKAVSNTSKDAAPRPRPSAAILRRVRRAADAATNDHPQTQPLRRHR